MANTMNPEIKAQWIADLRSGEFEQGKGYLNADGKLCCLGVLCEQAVKAGVVDKDDTRRTIVFYGKKDNIPPTEVREWAGLPATNHHGNPNNNPSVTVDDMWVSLAELNDGENGWKPCTFGQIADLIEAQL